MTVNDHSYSSYENNIKEAVCALKVMDYVAAQEYIEHAMLENKHAPEVHNLLGILAELTGDTSLAGKHYRAAYALDPTYKPADKNLERITSFYYRGGDENIDFGDKPEKEESIPYFIEYDEKKIGHLKRKEQIK